MDVLPVRAALYAQHGPVEPGSVNLWHEYQSQRVAGRAAATPLGSGRLTETLRHKLRKFEQSNIDQVTAQSVRQHHARGHLLQPGPSPEVMPEFHDRERASGMEKGVLARQIELERSTSPPTLPPPPPLS